MWKRTTKDTTVHEILETFAPPREGLTSAHLVSFGPQHYFVVVQGPEGEVLTSRLMEYIQALYEAAEDKRNGE